MNNVFEIIDRKILDHKAEIFPTVDEMAKVQKKVQENLGKGIKDLTEAHSLFIIKGKLDFHKACIVALEDLKETIKNENATSEKPKEGTE
jgi:hypothetical protein